MCVRICFCCTSCELLHDVNVVYWEVCKEDNNNIVISFVGPLTGTCVAYLYLSTKLCENLLSTSCKLLHGACIVYHWLVVRPTTSPATNNLKQQQELLLCGNLLCSSICCIQFCAIWLVEQNNTSHNFLYLMVLYITYYLIKVAASSFNTPLERRAPNGRPPLATVLHYYTVLNKELIREQRTEV
jgi:hypothetical protein